MKGARMIGMGKKMPIFFTGHGFRYFRPRVVHVFFPPDLICRLLELSELKGLFETLEMGQLIVSLFKRHSFNQS